MLPAPFYEAAMGDTEHVFGVGHKNHPVTKMPLESGRGHLPEREQGYLHLVVIEQNDGKEAAAAMRQKLDAHYRGVA